MPQELTKYVGWPEVCEALGLSQSTIERRIRKGTFPKPKQLSTGRVGWTVAAVNEAMASSLDEVAVANPADLKPEAAIKAATTQAFDAVERLTGERPEYALFTRDTTQSEREALVAREFADTFGAMSKMHAPMNYGESLLAASCLFPAIAEVHRGALETAIKCPLPATTEHRVELYIAAVVRALERTKAAA